MMVYSMGLQDETPSAVTMQIDISQSEIKWKGYEPGGEHVGTLKFKSGIIKLQGSQLIEGFFTADMQTIHDLDQKGFLLDKLESHLKSDDFFDVDKYPESSLVIDKSDHTADSNGYYGCTARLTIKGITQEILFKAKFVIDENSVLHGETLPITLDRTKWGINYGSKNIFKQLTEHIIADHFDIRVFITAK